MTLHLPDEIAGQARNDTQHYAVLARKYRSQDFQSLIGQDVLVKTLTTAINTGRIAHAYIFTGIRGTGKTSTARILAKALNCMSSGKATAAPCGQCENCRAIAAGQHIDVLEIDAASHTGVDNMRDILDAAGYRPTNGRYKVYIIDEVHMLSTSAFNALLKTLEEPPAHVIFILATTEIRKVPVTILSRCQRFDLVRVPIETLKQHFSSIASNEKVELSDGANELISRAADGSVRDGLSLLDQAIAQTGGKVDEQAVLDMLKRADRGVVVDFMSRILSGDLSAALAKLDELYRNGADLSLLLTDMMEWVHWATRMHPALKIGDGSNAPYTADQRAAIKKVNETAAMAELSRIWQALVGAVSEVSAAGNQKQAMDMLIVRLVAQAGPEKMIANGPSLPASRTASPKAEDARLSTIDSASALAGALVAAKEMILMSHWNNNIEVLDFKDGAIKLHDRKADCEFIAKLQKFLLEKTGRSWVIEVANSAAAPTMTEAALAEKKQDPLVADALGLFAGAVIV